MKLIDKVQALIDANGLSQAKFEVMIGISKGKWTRWRGDEGEPNYTELVSIRNVLNSALGLNVTFDWLFDGTQEDLPPDLSEWEKKLCDLVDMIGPEEACRRLVNGRDGHSAGFARHVSVRSRPKSEPTVTETPPAKEPKGRPTSKRKPRG